MTITEMPITSYSSTDASFAIMRRAPRFLSINCVWRCGMCKNVNTTHYNVLFIKSRLSISKTDRNPNRDHGDLNPKVVRVMFSLLLAE